MSLASGLIKSGGSVDLLLLDARKGGIWRLINLANRELLVNNGFSGSRLVAKSRKEILRRLKSSSIGSRTMPSLTHAAGVEKGLDMNKEYDICILGAPWLCRESMELPKSARTYCIAYDAIPNRYYISDPNNVGLRLFASAHADGYRWADEEADGLLCISAETSEQCKSFGFGTAKGLRVLPPILPPGFESLNPRIFNRREKAAVLAAPFDKRKGLGVLPQLVNSGDFSNLLIFGGPRCTTDQLVRFFEEIEIDNIEWWIDCDFTKQVELYSRAKVLIFPSLNEGLGLPVMEAYACGTSVLASDIPPLNNLAKRHDLLSVDVHEACLQVKRRAIEDIDHPSCREYAIREWTAEKLKDFSWI